MNHDQFSLPFLHTYRTMCTAPNPDFLQALEGGQGDDGYDPRTLVQAVLGAQPASAAVATAAYTARRLPMDPSLSGPRSEPPI